VLHLSHHTHLRTQCFLQVFAISHYKDYFPAIWYEWHNYLQYWWWQDREILWALHLTKVAASSHRHDMTQFGRLTHICDMTETVWLIHGLIANINQKVLWIRQMFSILTHANHKVVITITYILVMSHIYIGSVLHISRSQHINERATSRSHTRMKWVIHMHMSCQTYIICTACPFEIHPHRFLFSPLRKAGKQDILPFLTQERVPIFNTGT